MSKGQAGEMSGEDGGLTGMSLAYWLDYIRKVDMMARCAGSGAYRSVFETFMRGANGEGDGTGKHEEDIPRYRDEEVHQ